jgi:predicted acetyltransferase
MSTIKKIPNADIDQFIDIQADAYPGMGLVTREEKKRTCARILKTHDDPRLTDYGYYDQGRMLGTLRLSDFTMNLFGNLVLAGGGGALGVSLMHKRQHIAKRLMSFYFNHYRRRQSAMAVLWPFRPDFYRVMGAGLGLKIHQYRVKPADLPRGKHSRNVRWLENKDIPALNSCYNRWVSRTNGAIESTVLSRQISWEFNQKQRWVGYVKSGRVMGYLLFTFQKSSDNWLDNTIQITELSYENRDVLLQLMTFLHTQFDQIGTIDISTPDDDFHFLLSDPRNGSGRLIPPLYHESHASGVGMMYRVINVERLFELMAERNFHGQSLRLGLTVTDTFLRANHGRRVIRFSKGRARIQKSTSPTQVEVKIDNSDFSSLIMGAVKFRSLYDYGLVTTSNDRYLDRLSSLFTTASRPFCTTQF